MKNLNDINWEKQIEKDYNDFGYVKVAEGERDDLPNQDRKKLIKDIKKEYNSINFKNIFPLAELKVYTEKSSDHISIIALHSRFGTFRMEDLGENYLIPSQNFKDNKKSEFIEYLSNQGIVCKELNENYLSIIKTKK